MSNLKKKFNQILEDIEKNIKNKEDLDYIKSQIYNISILFLDELDKLSELNLGRLNVMIDREKELSKKIAKMEKMISEIEKEVFSPSDCDFEIICPYCNADFIEEFSEENPHEVKCPECGNNIELDWNDEEYQGSISEEGDDYDDKDYEDDVEDKAESEGDEEDDM